VPSSNYFTVANNDSTHGHLATDSALDSLLQGHPHEPGVFKPAIGKIFNQDQWTIA
jgi:hypothetical protein